MAFTVYEREMQNTFYDDNCLIGRNTVFDNPDFTTFSFDNARPFVRNKKIVFPIYKMALAK